MLLSIRLVFSDHKWKRAKCGHVENRVGPTTCSRTIGNRAGHGCCVYVLFHSPLGLIVLPHFERKTNCQYSHYISIIHQLTIIYLVSWCSTQHDLPLFVQEFSSKPQVVPPVIFKWKNIQHINFTEINFNFQIHIMHSHLS